MGLASRPVSDLFKTGTGRCLLLVWACFLLRGFFYSALFPVWEGYDEWAHFAYVQHWVEHGQLPIASETKVSREVQESLRLLPLPWEFRNSPPPHITHDAYWKLPLQEREQRQRRLVELPTEWQRQSATEDLLLYQAQHPPLYYWLLSPALTVLRHWPLPDRVLFLRWLSVALASFVVPLAFLVGRRVFGSDSLAIGIAALITAMPELMIDVARVGNESLGIALYSLLVYLSLGLAKNPDTTPPRTWLLLGVILGVGLLTKAYFLAALPALVVTFGWLVWRSPGRRSTMLGNVALALAIVALLSGWWYGRNQLVTGTWSGLAEAVKLRGISSWELLQVVPQVDWYNAVDSIFNSHIWYGNWSGLTLRSWMYHFFRYIVLLATGGILLALWRIYRKRAEANTPAAPRDLFVLVLFYGFFWLGQLYNVLMIFSNWGVSTSMGWYMYCLVVAEVVLATIGLMALFPRAWQAWILPAGIACFALLELYATHFVMVPYYTGLIAHGPDGNLPAFHLSQLLQFGLQTVLNRVAANKASFLSWPAVLCLWILYLAATISLLVVSSYFCGQNTRGPHLGEAAPVPRHSQAAD